MTDRIAFFVLVLAAWLVAGCATPRKRFGNEARFSPAFRGYVLAQENGSDDPAPDAAVLVLREPLGGNKLRCREHVLEWREVNEDMASDQTKDRNASIVARVTAGLVFAPLIAMQPVGSLATVQSARSAHGLFDHFASDDAGELLQKGRTLFRRKRYGHASVLLERALAKDGAVGVFDKAYFYLGMSYAKQKRDERARLALSLFVDRAGVRDVKAYRAAEDKLAELGVEHDQCKSRGPVRVFW